MSEKPKSNAGLSAAAEKAIKPSSALHSQGQRRPAQKLNIFALLYALRRRWLPATLLGLLLAILSGVGLWFAVPLAKPLVYARIQILERVGGNINDHPDPPINRQTMIAKIKDPLLLTAVIRREEVAKLSVIKEQTDPEDWLMRELRVEFPFGPEILQLSMTGENSQDLKVIVNAVRDLYLQNYGDFTRKERQERLKRLQDHDATTKKEIERLVTQAKKNAEAGKEVDKETIALKQKLAMQLLEDTKKEITRTQSDLRRYRTELKLALDEKAQPFNASSKLVEEMVDQHPALQPVLQKRYEMQDLLEKTKQAAPGSARIVKLEADLQENLKQIEQKKLELRPAIVANLQGKFQLDRKAFLEEIQGRIKSLEETEKTLIEDANRLAKQSTDLSASTIQVVEEQRQIQLLETVRSRLAGAVEVLKAELDAPERIQRLNDPVVTSVDKYSNKIRFSILGSLLAFGAGLFLIAFLEYRTRRIDSVEDVFEQFGIQVVGKVPSPPKRLRFSLSGVDREEEEAAWQTVLTESVDAFRTQLLHTARRHGLQILMVSSAESGEGKTSLACHLAVSLARSGRKTLFIDADLRNPTAHELFQLPLEPGLSEIIRDQIPAHEAIKLTSAPGLWLLPAGRCNARVVDLLAQGSLSSLFSQLRKEYEFIVVDTSPILPVADGLLIAQQVDGVLFSLMHQVSRVSSTREALDKLNALHVNTLGAVINGTKAYAGYHQRKYAYRTLEA